MKILIVDDDPLLVEMYTLKFREAGFEMSTAPDGKKGLEDIKRDDVDLVLLDVVLPLIDGFEVLQTLQREGVKHPPIVLLTNLGQKEDVDRGFSLGAIDYVIKAHFTPSEVVEKVNTILKKQKSEK